MGGFSADPQRAQNLADGMSALVPHMEQKMRIGTWGKVFPQAAQKRTSSLTPAPQFGQTDGGKANVEFARNSYLALVKLESGF